MVNILGDEKKQPILALGRLPQSLRGIEAATRVRRETVSAYLKAAEIAIRDLRHRRSPQHRPVRCPLYRDVLRDCGAVALPCRVGDARADDARGAAGASKGLFVRLSPASRAGLDRQGRDALAAVAEGEHERCGARLDCDEVVMYGARAVILTPRAGRRRAPRANGLAPRRPGRRPRGRSHRRCPPGHLDRYRSSGASPHGPRA
jgi:hypothetical protein